MTKEPKDELPDYAVKFLAGLSETDVKLFGSILNMARLVNGWCRVNRWLAVFVFVILLALAQGLEAVKSIFSHMRW